MAAYLKANGNIKYCPKCSIRTERISGCAKMKCVRCEISWCWNCRAECSYNHFKRDKSFEIYNPIGWLRCPGYYKTENRCWMISKEIMLLLFLPVYLLLQPTCVVIAHSFDKNVKGIGSFIFWFLCSLWFAIIVGLIISLFFFYMRDVLIPHVPSEDPTAVNIVASMTSFCMSGVFWMAVNMFRVTLVDYQRTRR